MLANSFTESQTKDRFKSVVLTAAFIFFLYPIGIDGLSVNYTFCIYVLILILLSGKIRKMPTDMVVGVFVFSFIFLVSIVQHINTPELSGRRLASFLIFMSLFSFSIVNLNMSMVAAFKRAVILISIFFSIISIGKFFEHSMTGPIHFEVKNLIGSQRYGFIYILAFWVVLLSPVESLKQRILSLFPLLIITSGMFLTFSRSSIVALLLSLFLFGLVKLMPSGFVKVRASDAYKLLAFTMALLCVILVVQYFFPLTVQYYIKTLINPLTDASLFEALKYPTSSEGTRLVRVIEGLEHTLSNPITGTGYLGIWLFSESGAGSAHNQFLDTLIRVGIIGFAYYMYLFLRLMIYLRKYDAQLFWGMIGILVYGLFHETFKESYGAFVLAFMFGMFSQYAIKKEPVSVQESSLVNRVVSH